MSWETLTLAIRQHRLVNNLRSRHVALSIILIAHALLSLIYSLTTPLWESFDEPGHYSYARYIAIHRALPPLGTILSETNETHQPPLYYILVALPISLVDTSDDAQPRFTAGGNTFVVADEQLNQFPYRGTALAFRLGRMVSVVLSTIAVAMTYLIVRTAFPRRPGMALLATALHAFWPLFLFMGGVITNDIGVSLAGSLTVLFVIRLWAKPPHQTRRWDYLGLMATLIGAILTKDNGLALVLFAALALSGLTLRDLSKRQYRRMADLAYYFAAPLIILFILGTVLTNGRSMRQVTRTIDIGSNLFQTITHGASSNQTILYTTAAALRPYLERIPGWTTVTLASLLTSYSWGFLNVPIQWLLFAAVAGVLALIGMLLALLRSKTRWMAALMLLCIVCAGLAALIGGTTYYYHARTILSSLSAIIVLITLGLVSLPRLIRSASAAYALSVVGMIALMSPPIVMAPAYQKPPLLDPVAIPSAIQVPSALTFGGAIRLLGYSYPDAQVTRDQPASITLYWRAVRPLLKDYALKLELFSVSGESLKAESQATPGNNNLPTHFWKPGDTFAETYRLPVSLDTPAPTRVTFKITWFAQQTDKISWLRQETDEVLQPTCENGVACEPKVGALPVRLDEAAVAQWANKPAQYRLDSNLEIIDHQAPASVTAGQSLTVSLVWRARADHLGQSTTFIHLVSADGTLVAQQDSPPRHGQYTTDMWTKGEVVPDTYSLALPSTLPPGVYHLKMGMYDSKTLDRRPAFDAAGVALADNMIPLQEIRIEK
jgi:hypothetical protein